MLVPINIIQYILCNRKRKSIEAIGIFKRHSIRCCELNVVRFDHAVNTSQSRFAFISNINVYCNQINLN